MSLNDGSSSTISTDVGIGPDSRKVNRSAIGQTAFATHATDTSASRDTEHWLGLPTHSLFVWLTVIVAVTVDGDVRPGRLVLGTAAS